MLCRLPDIYRAILEGVTFEMRHNMDRLAAGGVQIKRLLACGGGARSDLWLQIKADILGCEIIPVNAEETGAMGSAILGFAAVTGKTPMEIGEQFWSYGEPVYPDPENREIYNVRYELYQRLRSMSREI